MSNQLATMDLPSAIEKVLMTGDLAGLSPDQRVIYYNKVCESVGLNPLTRPFDYITLNDKLVLYARKDATDQLRKRDSINISIIDRTVIDGVYVVTAQARNADGRSDESTGAVALVKEGGTWEDSRGGKRYFKADGTFAPLKPEDKANAMMKAETKAKRRVTLSICGMGFLDETEVESIPSARRFEEPAQRNVTPAPATRPAPTVRTVNRETGEILEPERPRQPRTPDNIARCKDCDEPIAWARIDGRNAPYVIGDDGIRTDERHRCTVDVTAPPVTAPPMDKQRKLLLQRAEAMQRNPKLPVELQRPAEAMLEMPDEQLRAFIAEMAEALNGKPATHTEATYVGVYPTNDGNAPPADDGDLPF